MQNDLKNKQSGSSSSLPAGFTPSANSVVIGRAKDAKQASGTKNLRNLAKSFLPDYSKASSRRVKSQVVSDVVSLVRKACPSGAFVKKVRNGDEECWVEVDEATAREKVGYVFRDLLGDKYRSSSKSKTAKRACQKTSQKKKIKTKTINIFKTLEDGDDEDCKITPQTLRVYSSERSIDKLSSFLFNIFGDDAEVEEMKEEKLMPEAVASSIEEEMEAEKLTPETVPSTSEQSIEKLSAIFEDLLDVDMDDLEEEMELKINVNWLPPTQSNRRSSEIYLDLMREDVIDSERL